MSQFFIIAGSRNLFKDILRWLLTPFHASVASIILFFIKPKRTTHKYEVAICGLFKNEARFLSEWINYHLSIGVDHFYMYNNNSDDNYLQVLSKYIESGIVDLIDWPQKYPQMPAYTDCYTKYRTESKWIGFIDLDEFVCPKYEYDIKEWLAKYNNYPSVLLYWKSFGTGGNLKHDDNKFVIEQYTQCFPKLMNMGKLFLNTAFEFTKFNNPHIISAQISILGFSIDIPPINEYKHFVCFGLHRVPCFNKEISIQLNHYWSKAHEIFIYNKTVKTDVFSKENEDIDKYLLLNPNEKKCITKDYVILRFLLDLNLKIKNT